MRSISEDLFWFLPIHDSAIRSITWLLLPEMKYEVICSGGSDGRVMLLDPNNPAYPHQLFRSQSNIQSIFTIGVMTAMSRGDHIGSIFFPDSDYRIRSLKVDGFHSQGSTVKISRHLSAIWV